MLFDDLPEEEPSVAAPPPERAFAATFHAAVAEAAHQARMAGVIDRELGDALAGPDARIPARTLQRVDLLRQELEGLAHLLRFLAQRPMPDELLAGDRIAACTPLAEQRARFTGQHGRDVT